VANTGYAVSTDLYKTNNVRTMRRKKKRRKRSRTTKRKTRTYF
jgi:hypothetical protein